MKNDKVVVVFGRMNPPTLGHKKMIDEAAEIAFEEDAELVIALVNTQNRVTDPLTFDEKANIIRAEYEAMNIVEVPHEKGLFGCLKMMSEEHENIILVAGSDRAFNYKEKLKKYNGKDFTFNGWEVRTLQRSKEELSATDLRNAVKANEVSTFIKNFFTDKVLRSYFFYLVMDRMS